MNERKVLTTVTGPFSIQFDWKARSILRTIEFELVIDGEGQNQFSANGNWNTNSTQVPTNGQRTVRWNTYINAENHDIGDTAWLDSVSISQRRS